jgi:hypothetical protein
MVLGTGKEEKNKGVIQKTNITGKSSCNSMLVHGIWAHLTAWAITCEMQSTGTIIQWIPIK